MAVRIASQLANDQDATKSGFSPVLIVGQTIVDIWKGREKLVKRREMDGWMMENEWTKEIASPAGVAVNVAPRTCQPLGN